MTGKLFAIGDIHGCHRQLITLLGRLPFDPAVDTLVFLGDYLNRGPDSRQVLDTLLNVQRRCPQTVFLKGNHEQALVEYALTGQEEDLHLLRSMGVEATAASYGATLRRLLDWSALPVEHQHFLATLRFSYQTGGYLFTHADPGEVPPDLLLEANSAHAAAMLRSAEATRLASRRLARETVELAGPVVVFGHLPFALPLVKPNRIGIDTGAVYGNLLTAVQLPELRFFHA